MTATPLTLVMVSYNKKDTIDLAIASAANGTRRPDLLVVSDDGSNDGTQGTAEFHARKWGIPCIVVKHQRVGRFRLQTMRNTCAANALDGVIMLTDSDCIFGPHSLEAHMAIHAAQEWAVGTGPRYEYLAGTSGPFTSTFATLEYAHVDEGHYCVPVGANVSFKKSLWKILGGFDRAYEGFYGMDEFQFSMRAVQFGAVCVSDPLAYLFHCPHETVFGNRDASRNIGLFDTTFGITHCDEEKAFLERIIPQYWAGARRQSLLGPREPLDEFGAPAGFVPPVLVQLSRTLRPLCDRARECIAGGDDAAVQAVQRFTRNLDWRRLPPDSLALKFLSKLHSVVNSGYPAAEIAARLGDYVSEAETAERQHGKAGREAARA